MDVKLNDTFGDLNTTTSHTPGNVTDGRTNILDDYLLAEWENEFMQSAKNNLTQMALSRNKIESIIMKDTYNTKLKDEFLFNIDTGMTNSKYNNQNDSGRCFIFAACNIFSNKVIKKYNLDTDFQISQSYVWFYDQLEKSNYFLQEMVDKADQPFDDVKSDIMSPIEDGGDWATVADLVNKYGLVPHQVFPDTVQAASPDKLNFILKQKLREFALKIRQLSKQNPDKVDEYKESCLQAIYSTLALTLGTPPKPQDKFDWEFIDTHGNYTSFTVTPIEFYKQHVDFDVNDFFGVMNDPRYEYNQLYVIDNPDMVNGTFTSFVNVDIDTMKQSVIDMLKDGEPVYFAANVDDYDNRAKGVFDVSAFDYPAAFNFDLDMDKKQLLLVGYEADHAMVITGVHIDPGTNEPVRWKVQNSWGETYGDNGWWLMTDDWFDAFVSFIITTEDYVSKDTYNVWKKQEYIKDE
ncbi:Aminopeptidase C [Spathaspora sp. JA1]|nr:Aminopeptidase C [Spathaspora sp. JA1]